MLKESALEAVWNEQSRQWNTGGNDPEKVREAYLTVSKGAQNTAKDLARADALIVAQLIMGDQLKKAVEREKNGRQRLLGKSKAIFGKSMRVTGGTFVKATKAVGYTALGAGKVMGKTAVATATFDGRMLKEALAIERKRRVSRNHAQVTHRPSLSSINPLDFLDGE
jgi:hypothetical protein